MAKRITISDDVYYELLRIRGIKSFSEVLRELLRRRKGNAHILKRIFGVLSEEEYEEVKKSLAEIDEKFENGRAYILKKVKEKINRAEGSFYRCYSDLLSYLLLRINFVTNPRGLRAMWDRVR